MTSYPTIFRKYTSSDPISLKIGTIAHFDDTRSQKKIHNDSDIFDAVMTPSKSSEMTSSAKNIFRNFYPLKRLLRASSQMVNFDQFLAKMAKTVKIVKKSAWKIFLVLTIPN